MMNLYTQSTSQAHQDCFAAYTNEFQPNRYFVDLGCNQPFYTNNSWILESFLHWNGILIDFDINLVKWCQKVRTGTAIYSDLLKENITEILERNSAPKILDYVSLDLYDESTLKVLKDIDFNKYIIRSLTFEHDKYLLGPKMQQEARELLIGNDMQLVCQDVLYEGQAFEDWYINPVLVNKEIWTKIECSGKEHSEIFKGIC